MSLQDISSTNGLIIDACCAINLSASGRFGDIISAVPAQIYISEYVADYEATYIFDSAGAQQEISMRQFVPSRMLLVTPTSNELITFLRFAQAMRDDGEAYTGAIALHRGYAIATDDGKATKYLMQNIPGLIVTGTPELLKNWADTDGITGKELSESIASIERQNYRPSERHVLFSWWRSSR